MRYHNGDNYDTVAESTWRMLPECDFLITIFIFTNVIV